MSTDELGFKDMSLEDIARQCLADSQDWFPNHAQDMGYLTICLAGETGEFANLIKKGMRGDFEIDNPTYTRLLALELTDVFIYVMNLAALMGVDMEKMYQIKRSINRDRFDSNGGDAGGPELRVL
jgi:NTP pyrophosphatase (non-canonical NTP hydrolase)